MSNSQKYFFDESLEGSEKKELSQDVETLIAMYRLLSIEDKIAAKRMINIEKLF